MVPDEENENQVTKLTAKVLQLTDENAALRREADELRQTLGAFELTIKVQAGVLSPMMKRQ